MKPTMRARELRRSLTPQEARLWRELRGLRPKGFHFRRQAPVKGFVCFQERLVIEVDGGQHGDDVQADHDVMRDNILRRAGFRSLRFWNSEVNTNLEGVMYSILYDLGAINESVTPPRTALPSRPSP
jgi:very-short-patch-repair endonuclease